jgi:4,5-DOPA dioxygenase extradiol
MIKTTKKMPALFIGHGSPMNAIEDNKFTKVWEELAQRMPKPEAIIAISAHWYTDGTRITDDEQPKMVYDMYGFPEELYKVIYPSKGSPELAHMTMSLLNKEVIVDNSWGIDHGTWSVLRKMYPQADIPVFQLSIDRNADANTHFRIGQELSSLREKGVLIFGSGNVVHNLARVDWDMDGGYPWAVEFDNYIKENIINRQFENVIDYKNAGESSRLAFTTLEHFYPLLYVLGASNEEDKLTIYNETCNMGSLSMTGYLFE